MGIGHGSGRSEGDSAGFTHLYRLTGTAEVELRPAEPIKLLEVNEYTVPSGIMPLQFGPSPASGLDYSSIIKGHAGRIPKDSERRVDATAWMEDRRADSEGGGSGVRMSSA